jgi:localization factor PodJL
LTERRQSDEQVSGMLDTMQQALIGLLDRMDSIERQTADAVAAANAAASAVEQLPETFAAAMPAPQPLPSPPHEPAPAGPAPMSSEPVPPSMPAALPTPSVAHAPEQTSLSAFTTRPPHPAEPPALSERTKDDMIASARRAAAQASQRQAEQAGQAQPAKSRGKAAAKGRGLSIAPLLNRRVLIAILAVVAATSAYMALTRKPATPPAALPKIEKGVPPGTVAPQKSGSLETDRNIRLSDAASEEVADDVQQASVVQRPGSPGMPGLVVQTTRPVSPLDMLRQREQDGFARLSAQLGPRAASSVAASGIEPVEPREAEPDRAAAAKDLPPASVGPQSLRIAARDGDPAAEFAVGSRLAEGRGVPQDIEQAAIWYQRAAQKGFAIAQYRLATYYERGIGVSKDLGRALVWYRRAAEQGNVKAMHNLGVLLSSRDLGAPDYAAAVPLFQKAADTGLRDSQYNLAVLYESGLGVEQDFARAYRYLALAARQGDAQAVKRLAPVRAKLAPADAAAIDDQLAQWRPVPADPVANDPIVAGETWKARVPATPAG